MSLKAIAGKLFAKFIVNKTKKESANAIALQEQCFLNLIEKGKQTQFGKDHNFSQIKNYTDFKNLVPIADYEKLKPYVDRMVEGKENVLWPGKPIYLSKTQVQLLVQSIFPLQKIQCNIIWMLQEMHSSLYSLHWQSFLCRW